MSTSDLLFEIGTEEIPAGFMSWVTVELARLAEAALTEMRLPHGDLRVTGTPRRIALSVKDVAERQEDFEEEVKGPPKTNALDADGKYTKAALGFAKSRGVDESALRFQAVKGVEYLFATVRESGRDARELLPEFLSGLMKRLVFPKNMYWADPTVRFARPIRWLVALWGDEVVPFEHGGISSGRTSRGHRFMGAKSVEIASAADYESALEREFVIVDHERRKRMITDGIAAIEREHGVKVDDDPALLEENAFLVEYPVPFVGSFEEKYLDVPEEVLIATMKKNQRYFPARGADGRLAALFVGVSNNRAKDMAVVRAGNERVLRARLNDAEFFWREDQKTTLESRVPELKKVLYQEKIGSVFDKCERVRKLTSRLVGELGMNDIAGTADRAASLAKADLVTGMVFEFPEVQGVMGREYAKREGEPAEVCAALFEQYLPRFAGDELPKGHAGAAVGICDRVDSIVAIHKAGLPPTGSQDPYALRRAARCINEIAWGMKLDIDLRGLVEEAARLLGADESTVEAASSFIRQRTHNQLRERGHGHGTTSLAVSSMGMRPLQALAMLEAFDAASGEQWFTPLIQSAIRVGNILSKLSDADRAAAKLDAASMTLDQEKALKAALDTASTRVSDALSRSDWRAVCEELAALSPVIAAFFDGVMVMDDDPVARSNRLALLTEAKGLFDSIGDFALLKG